MNIDDWIGFKHLNDLGICSEQLVNCDVICLPENIEYETDPKKLREAMETVYIHKILKSNGIRVSSLHDFGYNIPSYERRGETLYFGIIVIKYSILPVVAGIIANWITQKVLHKGICIKLCIVKNENVTYIKYEGEGETFKCILEDLKR